MVINLDPKLEGGKDHHWQAQKHNQRQLGIDCEHKDHCENDVGGRPRNVHNAPAKQLAHAFGIGSDPRHNPTQGCFAEITQGKLLQVSKDLHAQFIAQFFAHDAGAINEDEEPNTRKR